MNKQTKLKKYIVKEGRVKFDFITIASHQLRTPLSAMKWFLEMLLSGNTGKLTRKQHDFINEIYKSNERMIRLVNDLLIVSRINDGTFKVVKRPFALEKVLNSVIKAVKPYTDLAKITVVKKYDSKKETFVLGDEDKVKQVVRSLIDNAARYMVNGGLVVIDCICTLNDVTFQIHDTGVGIPTRERSKVFQSFYRGSNVVKMRTDGTGLGLYITQAIVQALGGKIRFTSEEGKGTLFSVTLPRSKSVKKRSRVKSKTRNKKV